MRFYTGSLQMHIYGLADLHLALGVPEKTMEVFGDPWIGYHQKICSEWQAVVHPEDIVLLPGDISWAMNLSEAHKDFAFIGDLPGTKYMIRGNHDYWSSASTSKILQALPPSLYYLNQGFALLTPHLAVVGVRLWDSPTICVKKENFLTPSTQEQSYTEQDEKIFLRELGRLKRAFAALPKEVTEVIVMTHYPPISSDGTPGPISEFLEADGRVSLCLFGHIHKVQRPIDGFGNIRGIHYILVAADYVNFVPQEVM
ncbi:putative phosphoesterase CT488 [Chlamydia pneumoniae TW-183]|uniref:Phosphoesterase CT488 n=3 Tax=Chlamydia pneumoniae TaxID=83558 RepID=A0ABM5LCV7_CHLPN|nr:putative phosphoesterase CT488 [Chlamydia pneumoniae TW-183]CRI33122.1 Putative phosphoesterase CT488 [Chlamydia pneumoniae]CRI35985.1 Putative phosphoesterase CT488 [Chlamydia pneumoniae]CRI37112.1 Putative phosphoesterase CT488 [Chlamydia pneumoniae]CRI38240.1 Putative phosphoesterase CT488 [Chlamydia pneumoniae]